MALQSKLFQGDRELEAAAVSDPAHILQGARGEHVRKIQQALIQLDGAILAVDAMYGPKTAAAVATYKRKRKILNYQGQIDDIVGKKTTAALDREMAKRESALSKAFPLLLLAFGISPPPVPSAKKFRIRTALIGRPASKVFTPMRIYQIVDTENRLTAFYAMTSNFKTLEEVRGEFANQKLLDKGAFRDFTTTLPVQVTGFQPEPCMEKIIKLTENQKRERVELSLAVFQKDGLTITMEGFQDDNPSTGTLTRFGAMLLIEAKPRKVLE